MIELCLHVESEAYKDYEKAMNELCFYAEKEVNPLAFTHRNKDYVFKCGDAYGNGKGNGYGCGTSSRWDGNGFSEAQIPCMEISIE